MTTLSQAARTQSRVAEHAALMRKFMSEGMERNAASKKALDVITGKIIETADQRNAATKKAKELYEAMQGTICYLAGRWLDEREYEDKNEYADVIKAKLPADVMFEALTLRPFGFKFKVDGFRFHINATTTAYRMKAIA